MTRAALALVLFAAACGSKSSTGPTGNTGGGDDGATLTVQLAPGQSELDEVTATLAAADGSRFPAVSADGKTVVDLVLDEEDFTGFPIATVVFWTRDGVAASFTVTSQPVEGAPPDHAKTEELSVAEINRELAKTTWHPLASVQATGESEDTGAPDTIDLGDGVAVHLADVADKFPAAGSLPSESGGGGCGEVIGLDRGFGSKELGFAVVFPAVTLGGDECFGAASAQLGLVVPL